MLTTTPLIWALRSVQFVYPTTCLGMAPYRHKKWPKGSPAWYLIPLTSFPAALWRPSNPSCESESHRYPAIKTYTLHTYQPRWTGGFICSLWPLKTWKMIIFPYVPLVWSLRMDRNCPHSAWRHHEIYQLIHSPKHAWMQFFRSGTHFEWWVRHRSWANSLQKHNSNIPIISIHGRNVPSSRELLLFILLFRNRLSPAQH